jgi:hypothetical protein
MILAACALLSCFGVWIAWRRHPLFNWRNTLRFSGEAALAIAAAVGVIVLAVNSIHDLPDVVQIAVTGGATILGSLILIFGLIEASTPPGTRLDTRLPPNVKTSRLHRARILPWVKIGAVILGICPLLILISGTVREVVGVFAGIGAGTGFIVWTGAYVQALRADRAVTALQLRPWLHWHYPTEIWSSWVAREAEQKAQSQPDTMSPAQQRWFIGIPMLTVAAYMALIVHGGVLVRAGAALAGGLAVLVSMRLFRLRSHYAGQRIAKRLRAAPADAFFGRDGVLCNGEFYTWLGINYYLLSATVNVGPPRCVELCFKKILPSGYGGSNVMHVWQRVMIPPDAAASDLTQLQAALRSRCPDASINLA